MADIPILVAYIGLIIVAIINEVNLIVERVSDPNQAKLIVVPMDRGVAERIGDAGVIPARDPICKAGDESPAVGLGDHATGCIILVPEQGITALVDDLGHAMVGVIAVAHHAAARVSV
jgi:hypothetical protein